MLYNESLDLKFAWNHKCDSFEAEIIIDGRPYNAPVDEPNRATFNFWENGVRIALYEYNMMNSQNDSNIWDFRFVQVESGVTVPSDLYPLVQDMSFEFANGTFTANCVASAGNATTMPCINGSFNHYGTLSLTTTDTRTNITSRLQTVSTWKNAGDSAPNYILKDVQNGDSLGDTALQTAVAEPGHCSTFKVC
jgi:hypothetical protein